MSRAALFILAPLTLLAACGDEPVREARDDDPAMTMALADKLMTDPDLVGQNRANMAVLLPDEDGSIPVEDASPELVAAAQREALAMVGGPGRMLRAPRGGSLEPLPPAARLTVTAFAAAAPGGSKACADRAAYTAAWAAKMPDEFPVYPRAAVQDAAGTDADSCNLRVVHFTTPVPPADIMDFYYTRASRAGFDPQHQVVGEDAMIVGGKGGRRIALYASRRDDGMSSVDLMTSGQ